MVTVTRFIGGVLFIVGIVAYAASGAESVTALAPTVVGAILLTLGVLAGKQERTATMMHIALVVSVLAVLASLMPLRGLPAWIRGDDVERPYAVVTAGLMALLCLIHIALGIRSFLLARRSRSDQRA